VEVLFYDKGVVGVDMSVMCTCEWWYR